MGYNILYVEDQAAESRAKDLTNLGFQVDTYDPSSDIGELMKLVTTGIDALVMDYRLTAGKKNACFDAPTIAQTLRSKHSHERNKRAEIPIVLMSNEGIITDYYNDFTSQDLFDFSLTKKEFIDNQKRFGEKLSSFIEGYRYIKAANYDLIKILGLQKSEENLIHPSILIKVNNYDSHIFEYSRLIFEQIIRSIGPLIGQDILMARLGVSKKSPDYDKLISHLENCRYKGILSDVYPRWWMLKIQEWWQSSVKAEIPLRRLDAEERINILTSNLGLDLVPLENTKHSQSSNFWTICKYSHEAIDPFDGIELYKKDIFAWQEKEYISIDTALDHIDKYKDYISAVDKKAIRELAQKSNKK